MQTGTISPTFFCIIIAIVKENFQSNETNASLFIEDIIKIKIDILRLIDFIVYCFE